jgi:hypothetical protein
VGVPIHQNLVIIILLLLLHEDFLISKVDPDLGSWNHVDVNCAGDVLGIP